jgi:hypothetical protein
LAMSAEYCAESRHNRRESFPRRHRLSSRGRCEQFTFADHQESKTAFVRRGWDQINSSEKMI